MLKKTITYTDYNGNERTEDFYFNLSKAELAEMELGVDGGLTGMITRLVAAQDVPQIMAVFKDLLLKSYGEKSADGKRFVKYDENGHRLADKFAQTEAYSMMFMELAFDDIKSAEFIKGIIPGDLKDKLPADPSTLLAAK